MLDTKLLRDNPGLVAEKLKQKGFVFDLNKFKQLEAKRKKLQVQTQEIQSKRNTRSKEIGRAKANGESVADLLKDVAELGDNLKVYEEELNVIQSELQEFLLAIPNLPNDSAPVGKDESDNVEIRVWGERNNSGQGQEGQGQEEQEQKGQEQERQGHNAIKEHFELPGFDFESSARLSGSRFVVLHGELARLHRALAQFMLNFHVDNHGYQEIYVPFLVKSEAMFGTGQFPKLIDDQFKIADSDLWLVPTGEVPLTNLVRDKILSANELPLKFVSHTPCFRREAGSYGKDTKGMLRQHQFEKVELVQVVEPDKSYQALEELTSHAEAILQQLELPYRVVELCTGDLGFSATKTYDLEVWLPGQNCYREISSCSNTEAFQARRMHARWRDPNNKKPELVHTLNGSGIAVGRALIAVVENYQNEDGSIEVPKVLQPLMGA